MHCLNKEQAFVCDVCKKRFKRECNLIKHHQIHTGQKIIECQIFNKQVVKKDHLTFLQNHNEEKKKI